MIVIKLNDELKRKIQGQNVSLVTQTTVNKEKNIAKEKQQKQQQKTKNIVEYNTYHRSLLQKWIDRRY